MIKINLLPKSIYEKKIVRNTAILFGFLVVAIVAIGIAYAQFVWVPRVTDMEDQATKAEALQKEVEGIEAETATWQGKTAPIQTKLTFINNVLDYNTKYPQLYQEIARWTYEKISYVGLTSDGTQVSMTARARSLDDLGRFLLNMYHATNLFSEVSISGVPGYPIADNSNNNNNGLPQMDMGAMGSGPQANLSGINAIQIGATSAPVAHYIDFTVNAKLKTPIAAPTFAAAPAAAAAGGAATGTPGATPGAPVGGAAPTPGKPMQPAPLPPGGPKPNTP